MECHTAYTKIQNQPVFIWYVLALMEQINEEHHGSTILMSG